MSRASAPRTGWTCKRHGVDQFVADGQACPLCGDGGDADVTYYAGDVLACYAPTFWQGKRIRGAITTIPVSDDDPA